MTADEMKRVAEKTVSTAISNGADTAEVTVKETSAFEVTVRKGDTETLSESVSNRIMITVSVDKRKASVTSSDLSSESISELVAEAVELAGVMDSDEYFSLPDPEELGRAVADVQAVKEDRESISTAEKIETALALEKTALSLDGRIILDGASYANGINTMVIANSLGFCDGYSKTFSSIDISCAAEDTTARGGNTGKKQSSYWYSTAASVSGLESIEEVASRAVSRTIRKLGAKKPRTCEVPVVFDTETAREFAGSIASAVSGGSIYRKASFLVDCIGKRVGSTHVSIIDDPLLEGKLGSRPFDTEGVRSRKNTVIEHGVLKSYLMNSYQARKLGAKTTGNAGGVSNFYMAPGKKKPEEIIAGIGEGLYLTALFGPGANWTTGDFSQGAQGLWIVKGELSYPVDEFTIASSFERMLGGIVAIADDLDWRRAVAAPTFMIDRMTISGT